MSRGLGKVQRAVLDIFADPVSLDVFELSQRVFGVEVPNAAQQSSVRRALADLKQRKRVERVDWYRGVYDDGSKMPGPRVWNYAGTQHGLRKQREAERAAKLVALKEEFPDPMIFEEKVAAMKAKLGIKGKEDI